MKTQELKTFSSLVKARTIGNNEEACVYNHSVLCQTMFLTPYMMCRENTASLEKSESKQTNNQEMGLNEGNLYILLIQKYINKCPAII